MSWPICISAWRDAISIVCQKPIVKSAATILGICVVLATPLVISWWCGGRQVQAKAALSEFELPLPENYHDELLKPGDGIKSGYIYMDAIQRLEMVAKDLTEHKLLDEAQAVEAVAQKLRLDARDTPWRVIVPAWDQSFYISSDVWYHR